MGILAEGKALALLPNADAPLLLWFTGELGMGMVGCTWSATASVAC